MTKKSKKIQATEPASTDQEQVALVQQCEEYKQGWQRALADYENLKRDMHLRLESSRDRMKADFAQTLLPVMDNFTQAVTHAPQLDDAHASWLQGVLYIQKQFEDVLSQLGLEKIDTSTGFDPNTQESVGEGDEFQELTPGWKIGDVVIRPAKVIVHKEND